MSASHSQQIGVGQFNQTMQNLPLRPSTLGQPQHSLNRQGHASATEEYAAIADFPTFFGRRFRLSELRLAVVEAKQQGRFRGHRQAVKVAKVEMESDGTQRRFLGRTFAGQMLKQ